FEDRIDTRIADAPSRHRVLAGREPGGVIDTSPIVCACHCVSRQTLEGALAAGCPRTVDGLGGATKAGTNCGSCKPELRRILTACHPETEDADAPSGADLPMAV
ncbi:MAG: (2Fe-2S)-binding protein, partial [Pseudomonadota bacterium]